MIEFCSCSKRTGDEDGIPGVELVKWSLSGVDNLKRGNFSRLSTSFKLGLGCLGGS